MNTLEELRERSGSDFDAMFMTQMVQDHKKAVMLFEKAEREIQDPALSKHVASTLPILRQHLKDAQDIQQKMTSDKKRQSRAL